jgi:hypothetical protein
MDRDEMVELAVAAAELKIPYQDAHRLLTGRLTGERRRGRWFVRLADMERLAEERGQPATAA